MDTAIIGYSLLPLGVAFAGALWTLWQRPTNAVVGGIQHLAAGVIFYAAAGELLPDAAHGGHVLPLIAGGVLGIGVMLLLRRFARAAEGPLGLVGASAVDAFIDGLALGLAAQAGAHQGALLGVALAVEFLFLGLSVAAAFGTSASSGSVLGGTVGIAAMVPVGAIAAAFVGGWPESGKSAAFAFGLVALLYLVTEELLVEAHKKPETDFATALFFIGFLGLAGFDQTLQ